MAHIVFLTTRYTSHLNSCYHVADRLRQQGHRLTIVSAFYVSAGVKAQGFEFVLLEREALVHKNREGPREHFLEQRELDEVLKQLAPDLLLIDEELSAYIIIAASHNIRTLLYQCWTGTRSGYGVPPLGSTLQPGKTIAQRLKIEAIRRTKRLKRKVVLPVARYCYSGNDRHSNVYRYSTIYKLAENRGFDIRQFNTDHWPALFFRHVPTLFLNAWELDLPNAIREEDLEWFVGPQIFLKRTQTNIDSDFSEAFAYMTQPDVSGTKVPIVYCAMGSIVGDLDYFQRVVQAFAKRPHYSLSRSKFGVFGDFQSRLQGFWSHLFRFRLQKTTYFISENRPNLTQKLDIDRQICIYVNCLARILSQNLKFGSTEASALHWATGFD
ncbi:hypothetical protein KFU94_33150 [Chloroflexi bacterium TSY]|nr:hypothetical protein [Chloroflexi bacterium TSY]